MCQELNGQRQQVDFSITAKQPPSKIFLRTALAAAMTGKSSPFHFLTLGDNQRVCVRGTSTLSPDPTADSTNQLSLSANQSLLSQLHLHQYNNFPKASESRSVARLGDAPFLGRTNISYDVRLLAVPA